MTASGRASPPMSAGTEGPREGGQGAPAGQRNIEGRLDLLRDRARRSTEEVVRYIDSRKSRWGVEPICTTLQFASRTYYAVKRRPPCARRVSDEKLKPEITRVHKENLDVYGADKVWTQMKREGYPVARCTVERLMKDLHLSGARRGKAFKRTTIADEAQHRPADLVNRQFVADRPNRLWVADLTYVKTFTGWVYVAFVIDVYSRCVVGWQTSTSLRSDLAIDALEMAI